MPLGLPKACAPAAYAGDHELNVTSVADSPTATAETADTAPQSRRRCFGQGGCHVPLTQFAACTCRDKSGKHRRIRSVHSAAMSRHVRAVVYSTLSVLVGVGFYYAIVPNCSERFAEKAYQGNSARWNQALVDQDEKTQQFLVRMREVAESDLAPWMPGWHEEWRKKHPEDYLPNGQPRTC